MSKAILDTDMLSEIVKAVDKTVQQNALTYLDENAQFTFTSASVYEILYGLNVKNASRQIKAFLESVKEHEEVVPSQDDYRLAGEIRARLHLAGTPIGAFDPLIAACALNRDLPLVTGNTQHFGFVQSLGYSLYLINWRVK